MSCLCRSFLVVGIGESTGGLEKVKSATDDWQANRVQWFFTFSSLHVYSCKKRVFNMPFPNHPRKVKCRCRPKIDNSGGKECMKRRARSEKVGQINRPLESQVLSFFFNLLTLTNVPPLQMMHNAQFARKWQFNEYSSSHNKKSVHWKKVNHKS